MADQNVTRPSEDGDDDKPLVFKRNNTASKMAPLKALPEASTSSPVLGYLRSKLLPEQSKPSASAKHPDLTEEESDSDDEKPLREFVKAGSNEAEDLDSEDDDNLPLSSRYLKGKGKTPKRPLYHQTNILEQSLAKKPKVLGSSPPLKNKQVSSAEEVDYDDVTLAQRMKRGRSVNKSSPATKKKVPKISSSSKTIRKGKKPDKASKNQPSSKSDNRPKKYWTGLVHNGVVSPPPYEPHGVKMLYDGKPVDLTPVQEEFATMFAGMTDTDYVQKERFRDNF